jgi:MFS family permease
LGNSIAATLFGVFVLRELGLEPWAFGIVLAFGEVGGFVGALISPRIGARIGAGRAILLGRSLVVVPWLMLAVVPLATSSAFLVAVVLVSAAQFIYGLAMGIEDANDISYRQSVAPDRIQGRMNSTIRTMNRVVFFFGALSAGIIATLLGCRVSFAIAASIFGLAAVVALVSPLRNARHDDSTHA